MNQQKQSTPIIKIFISIGIIAGIIALYLLYSTNYQFKSNIITNIDNENTKIDIDFILIDQNGKKFKSHYLEGDLSLIYFGVTYSLEDYEAMIKLSEIVKILREENVVVKPIFITLDPEHDNSVVLKEYLKKFDIDFLGLTGHIENIKETAGKFKVLYEPKQSNHDTNKNKLENSSVVYLLNGKGKLLKCYCLGLSEAPLQGGT